ncbi:MAG: hypothetical protein U9N84_06100 [Actinomycetota bacterium]|nr:hypothetical protein [Actinomycetota bacterium]
MRNYFPMVEASFQSDADGNPSGGISSIYDREDALSTGGSQPPLVEIPWQNGIMSEGRNGVVLEDMVEACIQRLRFFQDSKFRCRENALALTKLEEAAQWMRQRQRNRHLQNVQSSYETHTS